MQKKKPNILMGYLMIAMVVVIYFVMFSERKVEATSTFAEVMELFNDGAYLGDPYTLIDTNNKILLCLYGGAILDEEIEPVLIKQRLLFSEEILELNPIEIHLARMQEQIAAYREIGLYVHTISIESIEYDKLDDTICYITIRQHTNNLQNSAVMYYLAETDGVWKIIGWEMIEDNIPEEKEE